MHRRIPVFLLICLLLTFTSAAFASGDGGEHPLPWDNFLYRVINFVLFAGALAYFFGKKVKAFFKGRTEGIALEISSLETRKVEAQESLANVEKRIANLETERLAIIADYTAQGEALKASIIAQAERTATAMTAQAKITAQNEIAQAVETIRAELAEKIVEATEKLLTQKLSADEHTKLVDQYLTKVVLN